MRSSAWVSRGMTVPLTKIGRRGYWFGVEDREKMIGRFGIAEL